MIGGRQRCAVFALVQRVGIAHCPAGVAERVWHTSSRLAAWSDNRRTASHSRESRIARFVVARRSRCPAVVVEAVGCWFVAPRRIEAHTGAGRRIVAGGIGRARCRSCRGNNRPAKMRWRFPGWTMLARSIGFAAASPRRNSARNTCPDRSATRPCARCKFVVATGALPGASEVDRLVALQRRVDWSRRCVRHRAQSSGTGCRCRGNR